MLKNLFLFCFYFISSYSNPHNNYCFNVLGNSVNLVFGKNSFNISSNIFGQQYNCFNEYYSMDGNNLLLNSSGTDCLNSVLSEQGACPCPPNLIYNSNDNTIVVTDTDIGNITIKSC